MNDLYKSYATITQEMKTLAPVAICHGNNLQELLEQVPDLPGVYVIRQGDQVIHIGSSGRIQMDGSRNGSTIRRRLRYASTPFRLGADQIHFQPQGDSIANRPVAYLSSVPLSQLSIDCYVCQPQSRWIPSTLQSILLQGYLNQFRSLPVGNLKV